jgi:hypothetical protein
MVHLAERHGVRPLLFRSLRELGVEIKTLVREQELALAAHDLRMFHALLEAVGHLSAAGVRTLGYKGPALALLLYKDVSMREYVDLDVLVSPADVRKGLSVLEQSGYVSDRSLTEKQFDAFLRTSSTLTLSSDAGMPFELQWQIAHRSAGVHFDFERLWRHRISVHEAGGSTLSTFSVNHQLLVLALHGARHFWESLGWVADIAYLLRRPELDLPSVWEESRELGLTNFVAVAVQLAHECFAVGSTDFPAGVSRAAVERVVSLSYRRLNALHVEPEFTKPEHLAFGALIPRLASRLHYFSSLLFTPGPDDWQSQRLPASLHFMYPAVRISRLLRKSFSGVVK